MPGPDRGLHRLFEVPRTINPADVERALAHLADAETTLLSFMTRISEVPEDAPDEEFPNAIPVLSAVLRSVARAAGSLEAT